MTPEAKVKRVITNQLKALGAYYFYPATGGYGKSGVPDIVGCYNGNGSLGSSARREEHADSVAAEEPRRYCLDRWWHSPLLINESQHEGCHACY